MSFGLFALYRTTLASINAVPRTPWEPPGENLSFLTLSVSYSAIQIVTLFKRFHLEEPIILNVICELLFNSNS